LKDIFAEHKDSKNLDSDQENPSNNSPFNRLDLNDSQSKKAKANSKKFKPCVTELRLSLVKEELFNDKILLLVGTNHGQFLVIDTKTEKTMLQYW